MNNIDKTDRELDEILKIFDMYLIPSVSYKDGKTPRITGQGETAYAITQYIDSQVRLGELYGRLHQTIELFQSGELSADKYSKHHSQITDQISELKDNNTLKGGKS